MMGEEVTWLLLSGELLTLDDSEEGTWLLLCSELLKLEEATLLLGLLLLVTDELTMLEDGT